MLSFIILMSSVICFSAILALALNFQWGLGGMINFGLAGLYALGAYACAIFILRLKIGGGDIKLFAVLSLFFLPISLDSLFEFVSVFSIIAALLIVFTLLKERTLQSSIALAPAICGAFIWCAS